MDMDIEKRNSRIIIIYLYMRVLLNLLSPIFTNKQISNIEYTLLIFLTIYVLYINNFKVSKKLFWLLIITLIYMTTNLLLVSYRYYVLVEIFKTLTTCFIPLYIITLEKVKYKYVLKFWFKTAKILTLLFPIYILLYSKSFIRYADIGHYSHLNVLIIVYFLLLIKEIRLSTIVFLVINLVMGMLIGSRMLFISSVVTSLIMILVLPQKRDLKYYFNITILGLVALVISLNAKEILSFIYSVMTKHGLHSRNLSLFIRQLEGAEFKEIAAGRDKIYETVLKYITNRSGMPGGLAVTRFLTDGRQYYAHNVFLDFALVFGITGFVVFVIWYIYNGFKFYNEKHKNYYKFSLFVILAASFWLRSLVGAYFLWHKFFLVSTAILISDNNIDMKEY